MVKLPGNPSRPSTRQWIRFAFHLKKYFPDFNAEAAKDQIEKDNMVPNLVVELEEVSN